MKVTKIVREFVEEEVNKKYPMPELDKVAVAQLDKEISETKSRILKEAGEFLFKKMKEAGLQLAEGVVGIKIDTGLVAANKAGRIIIVSSIIFRKRMTMLAESLKPNGNAPSRIFL